MGTEVCRCGASVRLDESTMRKGAQTVGCRACNYTGRIDVRTTRAKLITSIITNNASKGVK